MQEDSNLIIVNTDGGARGNPGPAAVGVVIKYGEIEIKYGKTIGDTTNNVAEYTAVIEAIKILIEKSSEFESATKAEFRMDSQLVERQLNGFYKIKEPTLADLAREIRKLLAETDLNIKFTYVPRAENKMADAMVNKALDGAL